MDCLGVVQGSGIQLHVDESTRESCLPVHYTCIHDMCAHAKAHSSGKNLATEHYMWVSLDLPGQFCIWMTGIFKAIIYVCMQVCMRLCILMYQPLLVLLCPRAKNADFLAGHRVRAVWLLTKWLLKRHSPGPSCCHLQLAPCLHES